MKLPSPISTDLDRLRGILPALGIREHLRSGGAARNLNEAKIHPVCKQMHFDDTSWVNFGVQNQVDNQSSQETIRNIII